jgi:hypothetical protein
LFREASIAVPLNPYFSLGVQFSHFEMSVDYLGGNEYIRKGSDTKGTTEPSPQSSQSRGGCDDCPPPLVGGKEVAGSLVAMTGGPVIEITPMGMSGPFFSLTGGVGAIGLDTNELGGAAAVRGGYRYFVSQQVAFGFGIGIAGVAAKEATAWLPFAAFELRLRFL